MQDRAQPVVKSRDHSLITTEYTQLLESAVSEIQTAHVALAVQVATTVTSTYWKLGQLLFERKLEETHGSGVIKRLSADLKERFPDMGLSPRNLWNMKRFYEHYHQAESKLLRCVAVLPWRHILLLLDKAIPIEAAAFYAQECLTKQWSRDLLLNAIKLDTYSHSQALYPSNNFALALPDKTAQYATEIFRDSYNLGFLGLTIPIAERELEKRLTAKVKDFILELGKHFTFVGNQYRIEFNHKEYFIDMLFFHRELRSLVAIELKMGAFKPEYIGKMNFYLSILDKIERAQSENPSIGIILCAEKDRLEVEIALQDIAKPIAIAEYQYLIPKDELQVLIAQEIIAYENEHPQGENP